MALPFPRHVHFVLRVSRTKAGIGIGRKLADHIRDPCSGDSVKDSFPIGVLVSRSYAYWRNSCLIHALRFGQFDLMWQLKEIF